MDNKELQDLANIMRRDVLQMTSAAGSGHPTSCLSSAEIMSVLFFDKMSYDVQNPDNPDNDEFILSKGHAAPILYSALKHASCINDDLMNLREINSELEGHPIPHLRGWIKFASGSLGQGLSIGVGMALAMQMQKRKSKVYVLLGDSECSEGSVWEAVQLANHYKLNNLYAIIDINKLGQRGETMLSYDLATYKKRFEAFGWQAIVVDGHSISSIKSALKNSSKPCVVLAKTIKGKGVSFLEGKNGWHGKSLSQEDLVKALKQLPKIDLPKIKIEMPRKSETKKEKTKEPKFIHYKVGEEISTREAYGNALASLAVADSNVLALDAEVSNSTFAEKVKEEKKGQFIECYIAEQNMIGMSLGLSAKGYKAFASTFAAFLTRAHDQIRMASLSKSTIVICGSHAGTSIGEDGASQMGLEDLSMFRALQGSTIFYPSDANSTNKLVHLASQMGGIVYIRTTRAKTPVIYKNSEEFILNDFKVIKSSNFDSIVLIGSGITLHECIKAHDMLKKQGISSSVIDCYCVKPFPLHKLGEFVKNHGNKVIVVEDHYPEGGIGEMIASSGIKVEGLAIRQTPHSGRKEELMAKYGIDASAIVKTVRNMVK